MTARNAVQPRAATAATVALLLPAGPIVATMTTVVRRQAGPAVTLEVKQHHQVEVVQEVVPTTIQAPMTIG